jgi:hypothetical protein
VRVTEYQAGGGEVIRLLTGLPDPGGISGCRARGPLPRKAGAESSYRQVKTFQRGRQPVLRSASPEPACQQARAHLVVRHCLIRIVMELAAGARIDPDRISSPRYSTTCGAA